jgi:hypothetical protein
MNTFYPYVWLCVKPINRWAYALIEYNLTYEPLTSMKDQVVAYFIVGHSIDQNRDESCNLVSIHP